MDQLGRARRRPRRPVVGLDNADAQASGDRIQGSTGTNDATAHDQDVQLAARLRGRLEGCKGFSAGFWAQGTGGTYCTHHDRPFHVNVLVVSPYFVARGKGRPTWAGLMMVRRLVMLGLLRILRRLMI